MNSILDFWNQMTANPLLFVAVTLTLGVILVNGWTDAPGAITASVSTGALKMKNAAILAGGTIGTHIHMGIGDGLIPPVLNCAIYQKICIISDEEALATSRDLARLEGIMCGISSGTNVAAAKKLAKLLGKGKTVVTVLPDTAERYFSTPLFEGE